MYQCVVNYIGYWCVLTGIVLSSIWVHAIPAANTPQEQYLPCKMAYRYCEGTSFESRLEVKKRIVTCNVVPDPKRQCCLPQTKHMVCYDMMVDGNALNFDSTNPMDNTDYDHLCRDMLQTLKKKPGKYSMAFKEEGGGTLRFRYGKFDIVTATGSDHIQHLACSYE